MTDNEIIKALECDTYTDCRECPHIEEECYKNSQVSAKDILDLINRLQAEIERLQEEQTKEQLRKEMLRITVEEIKAEAIKEFAERLNEKTISTLEYCEVVLPQDIDNLVKEMVGDTE